VIVVIDYGMGNLGSIANMFKKVGFKAAVTSDLAVIAQATKLVLPGVGAFDNGMIKLNELGLIPVLSAKVFEDKIPVMGLCLGMQLFTQRSEEGKLPGLGWLDAETIRFKFDPAQSDLKIPHMGWNTVQVRQPSWVFDGMDEEPRFYFVHSYHVVCQSEQDVLATAHYGYEFASAVGRGNVVGVQFHPEKSHKFGMRLFKNFAEL